MLGLLLATACLYVHALEFGFIWDDPLWYGRVVGRSMGELIRPMTDYHFYRPMLVLYNRLFLGPEDSISAPLLHAAQIGFHLLNVALVYALSRRMRLGGWVAVAAGGLAAWYPFSYQAVAWAAPAQPLAAALENGAWLAYFAARRRHAGHHMAAGLSLLLFLAALTVQEGSAALAFLPLLMEWVLHRCRSNRTGRNTQARRVIPWLALAYPFIAAGFGLLWIQLPRQSGYTGLTFERQVMLYLLQGFIFPLLGRPAGYEPGQIIAPLGLVVLTGLTLSGLVAAARRNGRGRHALFGLAWALLGIAPSVAGLQYSYVRLAPRLFYYSGPGVALLWACALLPPAGKPLARRLWRTGGALLLSLVTLQSGLLLTGFRRVYATGIAHLDELSQVAQLGEKRLLFINFPDRYTPRRPPYTLGYWGITLAPVSVDLGAFPAIATGHRLRTMSRSMPWIDTQARNDGPYQIDMRGAITPPDGVYRLAHQMDAVYLSRHYPDGTFALEWAGEVTSGSPGPFVDTAATCQMAVFGETLCLQEAQIEWQPGRLSLTLTWLSLSAAQPHDTIFAHLGPAGQPPTAQADDDAWLGILPLVVWQPGDTVREQRLILLSEDVDLDQAVIRIGVYNRITGNRLAATTPQGQPLADDAITVSYLP